MDKVVHFEIPYDNKERASRFYSEIFGWKLLDIPEMDYTIVHTAQVDENNMVAETGAINGGLFQRSDEANQPIVVVGVQSVDETIRQVLSAGGKLVTPKQSIPNGSYARVADSEGNVIGIADESK